MQRAGLLTLILLINTMAMGLWPVLCIAQTPTVELSGQVKSDDEGKPVRGATVRVLGTTKGTITNADGRFTLRLPPGEYKVRFSFVGYRTEHRTLSLTQDLVLDIRLQNAPVSMSGVVVVAEDPGVSLMRRVIARKVRQGDSLGSYSYNLYTRLSTSFDTLTASRSSGRGDTTIFSIFESYSKGYYKSPDNYYNQIIQRRQTANFSAENNLVAFGTNLNAYDDFVSILGEDIATPFNRNALEYYDFVLESTIRQEDSTTVNRVRVTPKSGGRKLFQGYVDIDALRFVPLDADLKPNRAVQLPFDAELHYNQSFDIVCDRFVMPTGLHIYSSATASIFWVIAPRLDINIETVAYDYECNPVLDNDLFAQRRVEAGSEADSFDSVYWKEKAVLPLRPEEEAAYREIQASIDTPDSLTSNGGIFGAVFSGIIETLQRLNTKPFTGTGDMLRYNRVHGAYVGLGLGGELTDDFSGTVKGGYGTADKRWYAEGQGRVQFGPARRLALNAGLYRKLARRDSPYTIATNGITPLALLFHNDYGDYYYSAGYEASAEVGFGQLRFVRPGQFVRPTVLKLFFRNEDHQSALNHATWALFSGDEPFRPNPAAINGTLRSLGFELNLNYSPLRRMGDVGLQLTGEYADPALIPGSFRFQQYTAAVILRTRTLPLWRLDLRANAGYSVGDIPPQKFFSLETAASGFAAEATFRGMSPKEFYGDRFVAVSLEHNFGEVIPGVLRIPNIASFGIEFLLNGRAGWTAFSPQALAYTNTALPSTNVTKEQYYFEAGLGLNRLLLFFRFDVSARFTQRSGPAFFFNFSGATN